MPNKNKNKNKQKKRGGGAAQLAPRGSVGSGMRISCPQQPMPFISSIVFMKKLRYMTTTAITTTATPSQIGGYFVVGTVVGTPGTVTKYVNSIRVRRITAWCLDSATATPRTVGLQFNGVLAQVVGSNRTHSDTQLGTARAACVSIVPELHSTASDWLPTGGGAAPGTSPLFTYTLPANSVLDIDLDVSVANDDAVVSTVATAAAPVLGQLYALALDHGTSDVMVPLSVTTII